jgi:antitoxin HicB
MKKNPHIGSSLDDLFEEEGTLEEINLIATKLVIAWQISEAMNQTTPIGNFSKPADSFG